MMKCDGVMKCEWVALSQRCSWVRFLTTSQGACTAAPGIGKPSSPTYLNCNLSHTIEGPPLLGASASCVAPFGFALRAGLSTAIACFLSSIAASAVSAPSREKSDPFDGRSLCVAAWSPLPPGLVALTGTGIVQNAGKCCDTASYWSYNTPCTPNNTLIKMFHASPAATNKLERAALLEQASRASRVHSRQAVCKCDLRL